MQPIFSFLLTLLYQVPLILMGFVGLGLAIATLRKHPKVSAAAMAGIVLLILTEFIIPVTRLRFDAFPGEGPTRTNQILALLYVARAVLTFAGWGLILAAIFGWREQHGRGETPAPPT
jgi:hypothetical protein